MTNFLKHTASVSLGLTLLTFMSHPVQAGTRPCPTCGAGTRPQTATPPLTFQFPSSTVVGGSFTYSPAPIPSPVPTPPAVRPPVNPIVRFQVAKPRT